jgi:hypothetical protein
MGASLAEAMGAVMEAAVDLFFFGAGMLKILRF